VKRLSGIITRVVWVGLAVAGGSASCLQAGGLDEAGTLSFFGKPEPQDTQILNRYFAATEQQKQALRGVTMEVDIDAELPKLKKQGKLHALRNISKVGKVTYHMLGFSGDSTVKKDVIARYLTAEVQAQGSQQDMAITAANYKFRYRGKMERNGQQVYVFHLSPRHKKVGLFKGELWLDPDTCMPVRESGRFVKSPSIFFKKMEFVREYAMNDGVAVPRHIESLVDTRLVGPVQLSIQFANPAKTADFGDVEPGAGDE
jgi:hypothetical protein